MPPKHTPITLELTERQAEDLQQLLWRAAGRSDINVPALERIVNTAIDEHKRSRTHFHDLLAPQRRNPCPI